MIRWLVRLIVYTVVAALVLRGVGAVLPTFTVSSWLGVVLLVLVVGVLNALVRPILVRLTLPLTMLTLGFFSLLLNGLLVWASAFLIPDVHIADIFTAMLLSFALTLSQAVVAALILPVNDRDLNEYQVIRRFARRSSADGDTRTPGLILLEIDGLSAATLRKAIRWGYMPTLAEWLRSGSHRLVEWDSGLPAQTSAMQAGILHGSHRDIPAFRFYDKAAHRLLVSNHPDDADDIVRPLLNGHGLLRERGFSLNNWACGDAPDVVLTFTTVGEAGHSPFEGADALYGYFANTLLFQQALLGMAWDMVVEWREARYQRVHNILPRVERRFPYPLVRAVAVVLLPQLVSYVLISRMFEGIAAAYTTFVNYDEVAHHSGVDRRDALRILKQLDRQLRWITRAGDHTSRRYEFVVLSDHGQSQGATFRQRYGLSLEEFINAHIEEAHHSQAFSQHDEGVDAINLLLSHLQSTDSRRARILRRALQKRTAHGYVELDEQRHAAHTEGQTVVCPSGNLALVYFTRWPARAILEDIVSCWPSLIDALVQHPGIGFVLAQSETAGAVVLGKGGTYYLDTDTVEGENPLAVFGPHAAQHLRELASYRNVGDLVINSLYDPVTEEVAAFEELVGSHGGLGGPQNRPFILFPAYLEPGEMAEVVGAPAVYDLVKRWQARLQATAAGPTVEDHAEALEAPARV